MTETLDALDYHERTKHSVYSVQTSRHFLDWDNQPLPFKIYTTLEPIALPRDFAAPASAAPCFPSLRELARLLHFSAGITRTRVYPGGQKHFFRAAACTGALYHIDLYVLCGDLDGLAAGVYHFSPHDFSLRRLRAGDHRQVLIHASGGEAALAGAPLAIVCTSTFWRNSWKYQSRAYRHCFWDTGTILANLLALTAAARIPTRLVVGFADGPVNELLGLDTAVEAALCCVALGDAAPPAPPAPALPTLTYETMPLSAHPLDYPAIRAAHAGSSLADPAVVCDWRRATFTPERPPPRRSLRPLEPTSEQEVALSVEEGITRRGSARRFARAAITFAQLSRLLRAATREIAADFHPEAAAKSALWNDLYLIVHAVDDLEPGAYVYLPDAAALELLRAGDFRGEAGHLDLGQELAADASVNFYALCDLEQVVARFGNRGYRAASLEAAILGGRIYLSAYRQRLAATGLTFFDDEVTAFFSPHAAGKAVLFLTAVGHALPSR